MPYNTARNKGNWVGCFYFHGEITAGCWNSGEFCTRDMETTRNKTRVPVLVLAFLKGCGVRCNEPLVACGHPGGVLLNSRAVLCCRDVP